MNRSPDLSVVITKGDRLIVTFTPLKTDGTKGKELRIVTRLPEITLKEYRDEFYSGLNKFLIKVGSGGKLSFSAVSEAMQQLHAAGGKLNLLLFGRSGQDDIEKFFIENYPAWLRSATAGYNPPVIQMRSLIEHVLPLEFLPVFNRTKPDQVHNLNDLTSLAARFPGFSTIIQRAFTLDDPQTGEKMSSSSGTSPQPLDNSRNLPVRLFRHAGLSGARREREFFANADWVELRGPWPDTELAPAQFLTDFAGQLWEDTPPAGNENSPDQVHHFACHCDTQELNSLQHSVSLGHLRPWIGLVSEKRVSIGTLIGEISTYRPRSATAPRPLVFFNACGSSKVTPNGVASFPDMFLSYFGSRGVIGTETRIPDRFSSRFSELFYLYLVQGATLGEAIFRARWQLLKLLNNPLGILYSIYADPYLQVSKPIPEAVT